MIDLSTNYKKITRQSYRDYDELAYLKF
jgi:hypothetical protein